MHLLSDKFINIFFAKVIVGIFKRSDFLAEFGDDSADTISTKNRKTVLENRKLERKKQRKF